tara:strand:+ start:1693 stop:2556 length:864 start_codon:yes stop_codon:yes gene_type:complete
VNIQTENKTNEWTTVINPKTGWFDVHPGELWHYRDLIKLFIHRDFVTFYKQTILGPLWYIIQPLMNAIVFTIIFGKVAKLPTDGIPPFLFYLSGTVVWGYFASCLNNTSNTFVANANIFGKVYFPRLTVPVSIVITNIFQFIIQFTVFLGFYFYFLLSGADILPNMRIIALPLILLQMAVLGLGFGILISSLTTKYKDLTFAVGFGVHLWMFITPVVYPLSMIPDRLRPFYILNPMVSVVESFRSAFLGISTIEPIHIAISISVTTLVFILGVLMFSKVEKTFMDTV